MPIEVISSGYVHTLLQNIVYSTPPKRAFILSDTVLEQSLDNSSYARVTATTTGVEIVAPFVRCTSSDAIVIIKTF